MIEFDQTTILTKIYVLNVHLRYVKWIFVNSQSYIYVTPLINAKWWASIRKLAFTRQVCINFSQISQYEMKINTFWVSSVRLKKLPKKDLNENLE